MADLLMPELKQLYIRSQCVPLHLVPFEEDLSNFQIFWSTHVSKKRKKKSYYGLLR